MTRRARERLFLSISGVAIAAALAVGFLRLGTPSRQRQFEADAKRIENFYQIAQRIQILRQQQGNVPASLDEIRQGMSNIQTTDPVTSQPYEFRLKGGRAYELCAVFDTDSKDSVDQPPPGTTAFWSHPRGRHCFLLDSEFAAPYYQRY